ncbi:MAG: O-antigen ligase family protein [Bacteroidia bacterium]
MIDYIKEHKQFLYLLIIWCVVGMFGGPAFLGVIPLCIILLKRKKMYVELICGLFFVAVLSDSWSDSMAWTKNIKDVYLVMLSLFVFFDPKEFPYKNTIFLPFIPFLVVAVALIARSPDIIPTAERTLSYILVVVVLPAYYTKMLTEEPDRFIKGLVYTGVGLLLYGLIFIPIDFHMTYLAGRYRGVMGNPNGLGIFCTVFFAFFTIATNKYKTIFSKKEIRFIYITILVTVALTGSRDAILSITIFYSFSRFFKMSYWLGFILIIIIALVYQIIVANITDILTAAGLKEFMRADNLKEGAGRIVAWRFAWVQIQHNFFFGKGFGYESWIFFQNQPMLNAMGHMGNSHNSYLAQWLNTGLVGLIFFLFALIYRSVKASARSVYALPLMYSVMFSATFEAWFIGSLNPHTPMLILMWTMMMVDAKAVTPEKKPAFDKYKIPTLAHEQKITS